MALVFDEWSGDWYDDGTGDDTAIDYGYTTNIKGINYTQDKNGNWTYEDSGGNIVPISTAEVQKLFAANPPTDYTPGLLSKLNTLLKTNLTPADLAKMGIGAGALAGLAGVGGYSSKPTGYQGGIPQLTASQPMLTEPPPGRRPGSGGINYGTGVQYKDKDGKIVSDTSTPIADLYKKATEQGTYNEWNHTYGNTPTPAAPTPFTFTPAAPRTSSPPPPPVSGSTGNPPPPPPPAGGNISNPPPSSGIATGIDPAHPWSKASSDPQIKAIQDELEQLSHTTGTPEQRQAALSQFLHTTKDTPAQLAAASNGMWSVQDLIDQMQGNTNVFNAQTPWSIYSTKADIKGVQDALQQLSQTPGTPEQRQAALQNFLKTTKYTPAQLAAASNGMWSVADLTAQMAGNPVLKQASNVPAASNAASNNVPATSNAATSTPADGGFVTGGGGPMSKADYDKAVATETARRNAEQAKLDAYHISPDSPLYKYVQNPSLIPHQYGETDAQALARVKQQDYETSQRMAYRTALSNMGYGDGFFVEGGGLYDANHNFIPPKANETSNTLDDPKTGRPRYETKDEEATRLKGVQTYLQSHGNIIDTEHPWNVASTDTGTQSAQAALAKLNQTQGTPAERQAALNNFLKTTTFTPEQLSAASNGQWAVSDLRAQMAGNPVLSQTDTNNVPTDLGVLADQMRQKQTVPSNTVDTGGGLADLTPTKSNFTPAAPTAAGLNALAGQVNTPMTGGVDGGIKNTAPSPYDNPGNPAPIDYFQQIYGRAGTPEEQAAMAGKSAEEEQAILQQSLASWNASHPSTPQVDTPQPTVYTGDPAHGAYVFARGGLTNLDHGGFVIPADVVSHFGNGSSEAGLKLLEHKLGAEPIRGHGDGMSDSIPASIEGREKALVANEEAYVSPRMVAQLGDGDMDEGSRKLKHMMEQIRKARTGTTQQGKQINPNKFMPGGSVGYAQGGSIKSFATGTDVTGAAVSAGVTGTEQNLSNWVGPYATQMLGQAQALANTPYQAYTGPLTAGASGLQNLAFQNAANLAVPSSVDYAGQSMAQIGNQAQNSSYTPGTFGTQFQAPTPYQNTNFTSGTFDSGAAQQYMNPYLQQSLTPQLEEARRQADIQAQADKARATSAGAFGGGRQAIMASEGNRNLNTNLANITGQGYNTAYTNAMSQFNQDQARNLQAQQMAEQSKQFGAGQGMTAAQLAAQYGLAGQQAGEASRQFGANYGLQGLQTGLQAAQGLGNLGISSGGLNLQNINAQAGLGATQRGIESEGIAADKAQFEAARQDPYTKLQFQQAMLNGLPISATNYTMAQPNALQGAAGGATTIAQLLKNLGYSTGS